MYHFVFRDREDDERTRPQKKRKKSATKIKVPKVRGSKTDRPCAYCRAVVPAAKVLLCSGCRRRSYCSEDCEKKDNASKRGFNAETGRPEVLPGRGQGHSEWCPLRCGEEGLEWEIRPSKRGEGVFAMRKISAGFRIMVEGIEAVEGTTAWSKSKLPLNHACKSNAERWPDLDFGVSILFAKEDIKEGQEITISYVSVGIQEYCSPSIPPQWIFASNRRTLSTFSEARTVLKEEHWIICPNNCFCRNSENERIQKEIQELCQRLIEVEVSLQSKKRKLTTEGTSIKAEKGLALIENLLKSMKKYGNCSSLRRVQMLEKGFFMSLRRRDTLQKAMQFLHECYSQWSSVLHPDSSIPIRLRAWMENPEPARREFVCNSARVHIDTLPTVSQVQIQRFKNKFGM